MPWVEKVKINSGNVLAAPKMLNTDNRRFHTIRGVLNWKGSLSWRQTLRLPSELTDVTSWPWGTGPQRSWGGRLRLPTCRPPASCPPSRLGPLSARIPGRAAKWTRQTWLRIVPVQSWTCRNSFFLDPPSPSRGCCPGLGPQRGTRTSLSLSLTLVWSQGGDDVALQISKLNDLYFNQVVQ